MFYFLNFLLRIKRFGAKNCITKMPFFRLTFPSFQKKKVTDISSNFTYTN